MSERKGIIWRREGFEPETEAKQINNLLSHFEILSPPLPSRILSRLSQIVAVAPHRWTRHFATHSQEDAPWAQSGPKTRQDPPSSPAAIKSISNGVSIRGTMRRFASVCTQAEGATTTAVRGHAHDGAVIS